MICNIFITTDNEESQNVSLRPVDPFYSKARSKKDTQVTGVSSLILIDKSTTFFRVLCVEETCLMNDFARRNFPHFNYQPADGFGYYEFESESFDQLAPTTEVILMDAVSESMIAWYQTHRVSRPYIYRDGLDVPCYMHKPMININIIENGMHFLELTIAVV